jgi:3-phosphoshikimate 1-carboxyvinyltransferase
VKAREWTVPGDLSSAAFWLVAAAARPGAALTARGVGLNPRRTAVLDVLGRMGARIERRAETGSADWEPSGDVTVRGAVLRGTEIGGAEIANLIDELPVLAVAAALAEGETVIRDARELRVKESDRIATMCANLKLMGVDVEERPDGMVVRGPARLVESAALRSQGDHRVAMAMAVLALSGPAPSVVNEVACVDTSYPGFWADLLRLSGRAAEAAG